MTGVFSPEILALIITAGTAVLTVIWEIISRIRGIAKQAA
jgi:hypothetical protein